MKPIYTAAASVMTLALVLAAPAAMADEHMDRDDAAEASGGSDAPQAGQDSASAASQRRETGGDQSGQSDESGSGSQRPGMSDHSGESAEEQGTEKRDGMRVDDITGSKLVNDSGEEIGEVVEVVRGMHGGDEQAVVSVGGLFGLVDREVLLPLKDLQMEGGKLLAPKDTASTKEQLEMLPNYDGNRFEELSGDETVSLGSAGTGTAQEDGSDEQHSTE